MDTNDKDCKDCIVAARLSSREYARFQAYLQRKGAADNVSEFLRQLIQYAVEQDFGKERNANYFEE